MSEPKRCSVCIKFCENRTNILYWNLCGECFYHIEKAIEDAVFERTNLLFPPKGLKLEEFLLFRKHHLDETRHMSGGMEKNRWYKHVTKYKEEAIPFMLWDFERYLNKEVEDCPFWFNGLYFLTGAQIIPHEMRGKIKEMMKTWVEWGKKTSYYAEVLKIKTEKGNCE